jgi:hypothetical protein
MSIQLHTSNTSKNLPDAQLTLSKVRDLAKNAEKRRDSLEAPNCKFQRSNPDVVNRILALKAPGRTLGANTGVEIGERSPSRLSTGARRNDYRGFNTAAV